MPFFYRNFFLPFIFLYNFYHCLYMTGAGRYDPALGNETLHWRTLLKSTVHMFYERKMILYRKVIYSNTNFSQSLDTRNCPFLTNLSF